MIESHVVSTKFAPPNSITLMVILFLVGYGNEAKGGVKRKGTKFCGIENETKILY